MGNIIHLELWGHRNDFIFYSEKDELTLGGFEQKSEVT